MERFDVIIESYWMNSFNCMKTKEKEIQVDMFVQSIVFKFGKKTKFSSTCLFGMKGFGSELLSRRFFLSSGGV